MATITLYRRQTSGSMDAGTTVAFALATGGENKSSQGDMRLSVRGLTWHLWAAQTGSPAPKIDDRITDVNGIGWVIDHVVVATLGTRYRCETTREIGSTP